MNKVIISGNLTKDVESGSTLSGIQYSKFSIAVNREYKDSEGNKVVDFFDVTIWRGLAESCKMYLAKGSKVLVVGQLNNSSYEKNGEKRYRTEVVAETVEFLSAKKQEQNNSGQRPVAKLKEVNEDDFPF